MINLSPAENQIRYVTNFKDLVSTPFQGEINAICWTRKLIGDFSEIVTLLETSENMVTDFAQKIKNRLPGTIKLHSLKLQETDTSFAEWYASDNE